MEVTPAMIYNNYCNIMYPHINRIFGEGNWCLYTLTDHAIIYSGYFNIPLPSCFIFKLNIENVYIEFKESPTFQEFLDKNPKVDKNKPIYINIVINEKKFIINAHISDKKFQELYPELTVSLNNVTVRKIDCILSNITNRIYGPIKSNTMDFNTFHFLTKMHVVFREILGKISANKGMKEDNKQKLQNQIAKIDEMYSKNLYMSDSDREKFKQYLNIETSVNKVEGAAGASNKQVDAAAEASVNKVEGASTDQVENEIQETEALATLATLAANEEQVEPPAKKAK